MGSSRIKSVRQRLAFDIDTGYDELMESSATENENIKYDPKTQTQSLKDTGKPFCKHCLHTNYNLFKKLGGAEEGYNLVSGDHIVDKGEAITHVWVRTDSGKIIDGSRDQFGATKGIHRVNPRTPEYSKYIELDIKENSGVMDWINERNPDGINLGYGEELPYDLWRDNRKRHIRHNRRYDLRHDQIFNEGTGKAKPLGKTITKGVKAIFGKSARIQMARERLATVRIVGGGFVKIKDRDPNVIGDLDWEDIMTKHSRKGGIEPSKRMRAQGGFVSPKGTYFESGMHDVWAQNLLKQTNNKDLIDQYMSVNKRGQTTLDNNKGGMESWMEDSGAIRTRFDSIMGTGIIQSEVKPTKQQIETIGNFIRENKIPTSEIKYNEELGDEGDVGIFSKSTKQHDKKKRKRTEEYQNQQRELHVDRMGRNAKLRQRIAGLGFRESAW